MPAEKRKLVDALLLLLLLSVALALRLQQWNRVVLPDEDVMVQMTLHVYDHPFPPGNYPGYPGFPPLIMYAGFLLSFVVQKLLLFFGVIPSPAHFVYAELGRDLVLKSGRIASALAGTALVALTWRMGRELFGRAAAYAAALLTAVDLFLVFDSHIFKPDTLMALLLVASLHFALKYDRDAQWRWLFFSSLLFGLAVAAKYNAAVEALFLLPAFLVACRRGRRPLWQPLLLAPAAMALGFLLGAPNWVVHPFLNVEAAYRFVTYHYSAFQFYEKSLAYSLFFKTMLEGFGPILLAALLAGLAAVAFHRRRGEILIAAYMFVYVAVLGKTSYFGKRMVLPLLPAAALLIAGLLLLLLPRLLGRWPKARLAYLAVAWALLAVFAVGAAGRNVRRYNLLATASTYGQAVDYRFRHIPAGHSIARENFTPGFAGDQGVSDLVSLPTRLFRGPDAVQFLCSGLFSRYILEETANPTVRGNLRRRLANYAVFERIRKPRFSTFDDDIAYWYKKPAWVGELNLDRPLAHLPPVFGMPPGELPSDTCYLPLPNFEKSPLAGKIARDVWTKKIYSSRPVAAIVFHVLTHGGRGEMVLAVNGRRQRLSLMPPRRLLTVAFESLRPLPLHDGYVYSIEASCDRLPSPVCLVCRPEYATPPEPLNETALFAQPQREPLPELFAPAAAPAWCREFYRRTGIDPVLHRFVQTERLFVNEARSSLDVDLDFFPMAAGGYLLRVKGEPLVPGRPGTTGLKLKWSAVGARRNDNGEFALAPEDLARGVELPFAVDELTFVQFGIEGQAAGNFLVNEFSVEPDYLAYVNAYWLKK